MSDLWALASLMCTAVILLSAYLPPDLLLCCVAAWLVSLATPCVGVGSLRPTANHETRVCPDRKTLGVVLR